MRKHLMKAFALLLLVCLLPLHGMAQDGASPNLDLRKEGEGGMVSNYIYTAAVLKDTLYVRVAEGLYTWQPGQKDLVLAAPIDTVQAADYMLKKVPLSINLLLSDGEKLWGVDSSRGEIFTVDVQDEKLVMGEPVALQLDDHTQSYETTSGEEHTYIEMPEQYAIVGGQLFALFTNYDNNTQNRTLASFDMETGEKTTYESEFINGLTPYKEGKLLVAFRDEDNSYNSETGKQQPVGLGVFDPATDTVEELGFFAEESMGRFSNAQTIKYDDSKDAVLYLLPNAVMRRFTDGTEEKCAYLPFQESWNQTGEKLMMLPDGRVAIAQGDTVHIRSTNPKDLPATNLVIYGLQENEAHTSALKSMPDVAISGLQGKWFENAQALGQALVGGEDAIDILFLEGGWMDVQSLLDKGYALDVSSNPAIKAHMDSLYPFMKEQGMKGDSILAVPVNVNVESLPVNTQAFKEAGLPVPETFEELCQVITTWYDEHADEGKFNLCMQTGDWVQDILMNTYNDYYAYTGKDLSLDTPEFRKMAESYQALPLQRMQDEQMDFEDNEAMQEFFNRPFLIGVGHSFDLRSYEYLLKGDRNMSAPNLFYGLKVSPDAPGVVRSNLTVMLINSQSKNLDAALRYAENYVKGLDAQTRIALYPGENEPVIEESYEKSLANMQDAVDSVKKALAEAEGAEKTTLENNLEQVEKNLETYENYGKYKVSAEGIAAYRKMMEHSYVVTARSNLLLRQEDLGELRARFTAGQLTLGQFIAETDAKLRLIQLENQ